MRLTALIIVALYFVLASSMGFVTAFVGEACSIFIALLLIEIGKTE
ncbi:MAG: hypothetical protein RL695_2314 [Pseudomonadota bacterium]|jgi:hypothetical protein